MKKFTKDKVPKATRIVTYWVYCFNTPAECMWLSGLVAVVLTIAELVV